MTFFITALGLTVSLVFFGVIIGFSPVLYAMVARYSVDRDLENGSPEMGVLDLENGSPEMGF